MLEQFRDRIGSEEYDFLLDYAIDFILAYTKRSEDEWLKLFDSIAVKMATIDFNRLGVEGYQSRKEGNIETKFYDDEDYPKSILQILDPYRLVKYY